MLALSSKRKCYVLRPLSSLFENLARILVVMLCVFYLTNPVQTALLSNTLGIGITIVFITVM